MKKIAAFIIMMICLATSNALAADYSEAVVDASSGKLHLRAQASQTSDSKGLYFSGTLVKCLSALGLGRSTNWARDRTYDVPIP